jgi:hypothetical protein
VTLSPYLPLTREQVGQRTTIPHSQRMRVPPHISKKLLEGRKHDVFDKVLDLEEAIGEYRPANFFRHSLIEAWNRIELVVVIHLQIWRPVCHLEPGSYRAYLYRDSEIFEVPPGGKWDWPYPRSYTVNTHYRGKKSAMLIPVIEGLQLPQTFHTRIFPGQPTGRGGGN